MTSPVFDFPSISRKLNRMEQKADWDAKNPKPDPVQPTWHPQWGYGMAPTVPMKSMAHPEWPYAGPPFEWSKFVNFKI